MSARILVVEDEPEVLKLIARYLRDAGYKVFTALNGENGLRLARELLPDLIILDVILPDLEGFSVCETLRQRSPTAHIPILMLTGLAGEIPRCHAFECGVNEFIRKPFRVPDLLEHVKRTLAPHAAQTESP